MQCTGVQTARQAKARTFEDAQRFIRTLNDGTAADTDEISSHSSSSSDALKCGSVVVKPWRGCASGDVYLCTSWTQVRAAIDAIIGTPLYATPGARNEASTCA